jgi:hypothetical protein
VDRGADRSLGSAMLMRRRVMGVRTAATGVMGAMEVAMEMVMVAMQALPPPQRRRPCLASRSWCLDSGAAARRGIWAAEVMPNCIEPVLSVCLMFGLSCS